MNSMRVTHLAPTQQLAFDRLLRLLPLGNVYTLLGAPGSGKTEILRELQQSTEGILLNLKEVMEAMQGQHPLALEETFEKLMMRALSNHPLVIFDDLDLLCDVMCGYRPYPRAGLLNGPLLTLCTYAEEARKQIIFASDHHPPEPLYQRALRIIIGEFTAADYAYLCNAYLDPLIAAGLDYRKIFRFAPKLNAHQLKNSCLVLRGEPELDTDLFVDYLRSQELASNIDLSEVQPVELNHLKGVEEVLESLEANIIIPLEFDELAHRLQLVPKRGVLLAGPPGTGKTTVGRALAHRLKSKFFLIDGTFISGAHDFYRRIHDIFEAAKLNAPSIIFIDDSDVIFESGEELGLYRYLLTMLDGLESESAGRVCVMLTAMNLSNLPPALVRSGRIELWLEMQLPNEEARRAILSDLVLVLPQELADIEASQLAAATEGFTGADLKRLIEDGKALYAYDVAHARPLQPVVEYFLRAIESVRTNKQRYAEADAQARKQLPSRPAFFNLMQEPEL
jgi:ATP-dependent 26S proteasome regulatory subunit